MEVVIANTDLLINIVANFNRFRSYFLTFFIFDTSFLIHT